MATIRKKPKKVDLIAVQGGRKLGKSYDQIARDLGVSSSAVWYALNRPHGQRQTVFPAGRQRSLYATDGRWANVVRWADEAGVSRSELLGRLIDAEQQRRGE